MVRHLERPPEGHGLREMQVEGLEGVLEQCRNAILQARDDGDLETARVYAEQADRAAAELVARDLERRAVDEQCEQTGEWYPEEPDL